MSITVKVFSGYKETYKKHYEDAVKLAYLKDGIEIDSKDLNYEIEYLEGNGIASQRRNAKSSRTITVIENNEIKYLIGLSNTGFDDDILLERQAQNKQYKYGHSDYHGNTYLLQGINKIFKYYFDKKEENQNVKLYFYLLDTDRTYPKNQYSIMSYRKLATLGFDVLNVDKISFDSFMKLGFSVDENIKDISYVSFNKFLNDLAKISESNSSNMPSYLKCIDYSYDINQEKNETSVSEVQNNDNKLYIYTFKVLGAEEYESFLTIWTLSVLAKKENKKLKFLLVPETYNFRLGQEVPKITKGFSLPVAELLKRIGLEQIFETTDEVRQQINREEEQYQISKNNNTLRNQELFRNNIRKKGIQTKCYLCGCEIEEILEAAHLWGVAEIKNTSEDEIHKAYGLFGDNKDELFYKKYMLANSGDNGVWLCKNHHGLLDSNFYCFESETGKVLLKLKIDENERQFFENFTQEKKLPDEILNDKTKMFLSKREEIFKEFNLA